MASQQNQQLEKTTWRSNLTASRLTLNRISKDNNWFTGLPPSVCPGIQRDTYALSMPRFDTCTRQSVLDYFDNGWTLTELLFSALNSDESFYRPPYHGLRHPLIFYYVHPASLYINKLNLAKLMQKRINPHFEILFETGVDEMSWDDMSKNEIEWPTIEECHAYRKAAYDLIKNLIENHPDLDRRERINMSHPLWALFMSMEHERIHLETSSVLIRELPLNLISKPNYWPQLAPSSYSESTNPESLIDNMIRISGSTVKLGKPKDFPTFGWDNEYGFKAESVPDFEVSQSLVSNKDFLSFVKDDGYRKKQFWSEEGFRWRTFANANHPTFWVENEAKPGQFKLRTCFEEIEMPWSWACIVNFHEAKAFCAWKSALDKKSYSLINESEHKLLQQLAPPDTSYNLNLKHGSESAVDAYPARTNHSVVYDISGNVWQWAENAFYPLDEFGVHYLYDDFSTPCFDGKHQMIFGGSFISIGDEASPYARFHFRPHFFQHAGFRLVSH
ncbi:MAG: 5-histidylcysteine sulfoxide synthase [Candidatus Melainabacteria bacterium]|nr:5-histidylcysteine sulfoxide synthase [Candidatus Melainabacteria bacterium]